MAARRAIAVVRPPSTLDDLSRALGGLGETAGSLISSGLATQSAPPSAQVGSERLGSLTGAPPRTVIRIIQIAPGFVPTLVVGETRDTRVVTFVAPVIGFSIFVGESGVKISDFALPLGLPHDMVLPGFQEIYAVTDAPVIIPLRVQISAVMVGDRERKGEGWR